MILLASGQPVRYPLMMKRLALITITAVIAGSPAQAFWGKYGSMAEANTACEEWARAGGNFVSETLERAPFRPQADAPKDPVLMLIAEQKHKQSGPMIWMDRMSSRRHCEHERETNQFLGYEYNARRGQTVRDPVRRVKSTSATDGHSRATVASESA